MYSESAGESSKGGTLATGCASVAGMQRDQLTGRETREQNSHGVVEHLLILLR